MMSCVKDLVVVVVGETAITNEVEPVLEAEATVETGVGGASVYNGALVQQRLTLHLNPASFRQLGVTLQ